MAVPSISSPTPLATARAQIGVTDPASYWAAIWPDHPADATDWCAVFVSYAFAVAGSPLPKMDESAVASGFAWCPDAEAWAKSHGIWVTDPTPGAIVLYDWNGDGVADHTGIVESVGADNLVTAIEGNTGSPVGVYRMNRSRALCLGFVTPPGGPMARKGADSAYGPSTADVEAAISQGVCWWGWYVGGRGALHVWTDAEVAVLDALTYSLPIWVPALDLSGNPATDYAVARDRARALGWHGPIALDTEASMRGNVRLHSYVDGWCAAAAAAGDPRVVYGGGNYVGSAHPWWIINSDSPPSVECYQNGSGSIGGTSVDFDYADSAFPLATRQAPAPPPAPTYTPLEDGRTLAHVSITTSAVNGSGYADCLGDPGSVDGWSVEGLDPAPVSAGGNGEFFEYGSVSFAAVKGRPGVCRVCLSSSNVKGGTVGVNVTFGTPAA